MSSPSLSCNSSSGVNSLDLTTRLDRSALHCAVLWGDKRQARPGDLRCRLRWRRVRGRRRWERPGEGHWRRVYRLRRRIPGDWRSRLSKLKLYMLVLLFSKRNQRIGMLCRIKNVQKIKNKGRSILVVEEMFHKRHEKAEKSKLRNGREEFRRKK